MLARPLARHRRAALSAMLIALGGVPLACAKKDAPNGLTSPSASASAPHLGGLTPELAARVLAKVGEREITLGDYAATLGRMDPFERLRYQSPDRRGQLLDELIDLELLAEEAEKRGLDQQPETRERIRQMLRDELLSELRRRVPAPEELPEAEVRQYYDAHREDFREPERRRLAHIALASETKAKAVLEQALTASPTAWGKLVADASGSKREKLGPAEFAGDLGIVGPPGHPRGENPRVPEALRAAGFEIERTGGVLPRLVRDGGSFHVLRLIGKTDARDRTFSEAERSIRVALVQERIRSRESELELELRKKYPVTIDEAELAQVVVTHEKASSPAPPASARKAP